MSHIGYELKMELSQFLVGNYFLLDKIKPLILSDYYPLINIKLTEINIFKILIYRYLVVFMAFFEALVYF